MNPLALLLAVATVVAAAESPFVGKWKLDPVKSQFAGTTMTIDQLPSGEMRLTAEGQSYTFKTDGKEYPAIFGTTAIWKQIDANRWEATYKLKDKVFSTDTYRLSADGKTLSVSSKGQRPDGTPFENAATFDRVSGGPGLGGKWKTTKVSMNSPEMMEFAPFGDDGLTWSFPAFKASANMKLDGKDYPFEGSTMPAGFTVAATSAGPRSITVVEKIGGKVVYRGSYSVSADGKTLTGVFAAEGTTEKIKEVYERQ